MVQQNLGTHFLEELAGATNNRKTEHTGLIHQLSVLGVSYGVKCTARYMGLRW
jgi:hypothetical protein